MRLKALLIKLRLHWGFSVKSAGMSAAQEPFTYPPPSTLIGALARGYVRVDGLAETYEQDGALYSSAQALLDKVSYATAALERCCPMQDISRNIAALYMRPEHREDPMNWFAAQASGKVYAPGGWLMAMYFIKEGEHKLIKAAHSIQAVGSKEGLTSVEEVNLFEVEARREAVLDATPFYAPRNTLESYEGRSGKVEWFWDYRFDGAYRLPSKEKPRLIPFVVPNQPLYAKLEHLRASKEGVVISAGGYELIIPREVAESR